MSLIRCKNNRNPLSEVILIDSIPEAKQAALTAGAQAVISTKGDPPQNLLIAIEAIHMTYKD
jgi:hypothetical protein